MESERSRENEFLRWVNAKVPVFGPKKHITQKLPVVNLVDGPKFLPTEPENKKKFSLYLWQLT
jgi:hypothetical protein